MSASTGAHIVIAIVDCGSGMDAELLARIGEPFFTTKAPGRGMGLGMFLARAVVEGVGGTLNLESALGHGTTAQVTLPLTPLLPAETRGRVAASDVESAPGSAPESLANSPSSPGPRSPSLGS
jgi:K+-sensing histidine kinase KdpD